MMNCITCNKELTGKQTKFCSRTCKSAALCDYTVQRIRAMERKIHFVNLLGGKCDCCGYRKNLHSLTFHHLDPNLKELELDLRVMANYSMDRLTAEVMRCRLPCRNCHGELHNPTGENWWVRLDLNQHPTG